jgi:hypothetical protein
MRAQILMESGPGSHICHMTLPPYAHEVLVCVKTVIQPFNHHLSIIYFLLERSPLCACAWSHGPHDHGLGG